MNFIVKRRYITTRATSQRHSQHHPKIRQKSGKRKGRYALASLSCFIAAQIAHHPQKCSPQVEFGIKMATRSFTFTSLNRSKILIVYPSGGASASDIASRERIWFNREASPDKDLMPYMVDMYSTVHTWCSSES